MTQANPSFRKISHLPPLIPPCRTTSNPPSPPPLFLLNPLFWGYLNSQVRINNLITTLLLQDLPQGYIFLYFYKLPRALCLSPECLLNFLPNFFIRGIFTHTPSHSGIAPKFLSSRHRQQEITYSPSQHYFENLSPNSR